MPSLEITLQGFSTLFVKSIQKVTTFLDGKQTLLYKLSFENEFGSEVLPYKPAADKTFETKIIKILDSLSSIDASTKTEIKKIFMNKVFRTDIPLKVVGKCECGNPTCKGTPTAFMTSDSEEESSEMSETLE